jgi:hypothetical protein
MVADIKCVLNFFDGVRESGRALRDPKPGAVEEDSDESSQAIDEIFSD